MDLTAELFPPAWHWAATIISLCAIGVCARKIEWRALLHSGARLNLLFGFSVLLALLWSLRAGVSPGLNLHLLGAMTACLLFGPWLAVLALALALTGITLNAAVSWEAWPINFVVMGVVPVVVAHGLRIAVERLLPPHFFIFVFVLAFAGSAVAVYACGLLAALVLFAAGAYTWSHLATEYLPFFILLGFSEAWIGGALTTMMVVYKPDWVSAFDDSRYLSNR